MAKLLKADLHIHTEYSMDCNTPLEKIISCCLEKGINCIAIADHGTADGALKMQAIAPFKVIVAEEILTHDGEIMGMFLEETIPSRLSMEQTISRIRAQDGLVCIPHSFDTIYRHSLGGKMLETLLGQIDIIEVFNARSPFPQNSVRAKAFAEKYGIPGSAGSDAHTTGEVGNAYIEIPEFNNKDEFLQALAKGRVFGKRTSPLVHFHGLWSRLKKRLW
ncbi:PHP domain-containing protein [Candidatus Omnitrophota bacterium]